MAESPVKMRFFGSPEDAERAIVKLEQHYDRLDNKIRQVSRTSRRGTQEGIGLTQRAVTGLATLAAQYVSVQAAVGLVSRGYQQWAQDIDEVSGRLAEANKQLTDQLLLSGDIAEAKGLQQFFRNIPDVTQGQAQGIFDAISGAAPDIALQQRKALTEAIAPLEGVLSEENTKLAGAVAANLAQVLPERSPEDLADLALGLQGALGRDFAQAANRQFERGLRALDTKGIDTEESLAFLTEAIRAGQRPSTLASLAGRLEEGQTLQDLFAGRVELGREQQDVLDVLDFRRVTDLAEQLRGAQEGDFVSEARLRSLEVNAPGIIRQRALVEEEDLLADLAERMELLESGQELRMARTRNPALRFVRSIADPIERFELRAGLEGSDVRAAIGVAERESTAELQRIGTLLEEQNELLRVDQRQRPQINRNAQTEQSP